MRTADINLWNAILRQENQDSILQAALSNGEEGATMATIVRMTRISRTTCSKHMRELELAGKVGRSAPPPHPQVKYGPPDIKLTTRAARKAETKRPFDVESWADHQPVHAVVCARQAPPLRPTGPNSVWGLA